MHPASTLCMTLLAVSATSMAAPPAQQPAPVAAQGLSVVRDAETGALRAPTPAEMRALQAQGPLPGGRPAPQPTAVGPDGRRSARLGASRLVYAVVTRGPDGALDRHCVDGQVAADAHVHHRHGATAPEAAQEALRHDHR